VLWYCCGVLDGLVCVLVSVGVVLVMVQLGVGDAVQCWMLVMVCSWVLVMCCLILNPHLAFHYIFVSFTQKTIM